MKAQNGIAGYFMHVANLLAHSRIVHTQDIHTQKRTLTDGFLRGDVLFTDGSRLHFRELITTEPRVQMVSYSYHYMRADETLIFRYDDANHYLYLSTAPHHKHLNENEVIAANAPDLAAILREIEGLIAQAGDIK